MDKVTQSNASEAGESASAAEELNAQDHELTAEIGQLLALVDGKRENEPNDLPGTQRSSGQNSNGRIKRSKPELQNIDG